MIVGFTGTRTGMTPDQYQAVFGLLVQFSRFKEKVFHYGACVGADDEAALIADELDWTIYAHPANDVPDRYLAIPLGTVWESIPALLRNQLIVDCSEVMIAAPLTAEEVIRSGTWATIRYARERNKKLYIVYRNGSFDG